MNDTTTLTTYRNSDLKVTYSFPKGANLFGFSPAFYFRATAGATALLTVTAASTVNGSTTTIVGDTVVLVLKKADLQNLPSADVWDGVYDSTLTKDGFVNRFAGGPLVQYIDGSFGDDQSAQDIIVEINGKQVPVFIEGGSLGLQANGVLNRIEESLDGKVDKTVAVTTTGLVTGGGGLSGNVNLNVTAASESDYQNGASDKALTPSILKPILDAATYKGPATTLSYITTRSASTDPNLAYTTFPPGSMGAFNAAGGDGSNTYGSVTWNRTTVFGSLNLLVAESSNRVEAFGQGALRWARFPERETAVGSLVMQWLGVSSNALLTTYHHDMWDTSVNVAPPGQPGWDWDGIKTLRPGTGAEIAAAPFAATSADTIGNAGFARDALCELKNGTYNTALGYKAGTSLYYGDENTFVGYNAGRRKVFGVRNTHVGMQAGARSVKGDRNYFGGAFAGYDLITGNNNYFLTPYAGSTSDAHWTTVNGVLMMGPNAGEGITQRDNAFLVHNGAAVRPVLEGDMAKGVVFGQWQAQGGSGVAVSMGAGLTAESTIVSLALFGQRMGPNGKMKVTANWSHANNANVKTVRFRIGGLGGQIVSQVAVTSLVRTSLLIEIQNRGVETSQIAQTNAGNVSAYGQSTTAAVTTTADMSAARTLVFTAERTDAADAITLESWSIETMYLP